MKTGRVSQFHATFQHRFIDIGLSFKFAHSIEHCVRCVLFEHDLATSFIDLRLEVKPRHFLHFGKFLLFFDFLFFDLLPSLHIVQK